MCGRCAGLGLLLLLVVLPGCAVPGHQPCCCCMQPLPLVPAHEHPGCCCCCWAHLPAYRLDWGVCGNCGTAGGCCHAAACACVVLSAGGAPYCVCRRCQHVCKNCVRLIYVESYEHQRKQTVSGARVFRSCCQLTLCALVGDRVVQLHVL